MCVHERVLRFTMFPFTNPPSSFSLFLSLPRFQLRLELAMAGYTEVLTLSLCSRDENFGHLRHEDDGSAVVIANPKVGLREREEERER